MSSKFLHNTIFTGKHLLHIGSIDSTNSYAKNLCSKTTPIDGTVIITDNQTAGRGLGKNKWLSNPGENLTFSIIYNSSFIRAEDQFNLSMAVAIGVLTALPNLKAEDYKLKWPNDIYYGDRKLGGILIENTIVGANLKQSIVGIGLNVNQVDFSDDLPNPISLKMITGENYDLFNLLSVTCCSIEACYLKLKNDLTEELKQQYLAVLYRKDMEVDFESDGVKQRGVILGVDKYGRIIMESKGRECSLTHDQISWL